MPGRDVTDPVQAAVQRSQAAALILDRHKGALFPHLAMLHETFGPVLLRSIVSGAVEAVIIAGGKTREIGDDAIAEHFDHDDTRRVTILPFAKERGE